MNPLSLLSNLIPGISWLKIGVMAVGAIAAASGGFYVAWHWQAANVAREHARYEQYVAGVSAEAAKQAADNLAQKEAWDARVAAVDTAYQQKKAADDAQIADLSAAVAAGARQLFVHVAPADDGDGVPKAAGTPRSSHAGAHWARIDPGVAQRLVAITGACDAQRAQLIALQAYVRSIQ